MGAMQRQNLVHRLCRNAILLALLCVIGMFSVPLGDNVKVSLQLLIVFLIALLAEGVVDTIIVTGCYVLLGLFMPIYAGFSSGVTPTFGFVLGFVLAAPVVYLFNRFVPLPSWPRMLIACLLGLLPVYAAGTLFMMLYLHWGTGETLLVAVVPYLPFDFLKIGLAVLTMQALPSVVKPKRPRKPSQDDES